MPIPRTIPTARSIFFRGCDSSGCPRTKSADPRMTMATANTSGFGSPNDRICNSSVSHRFPPRRRSIPIPYHSRKEFRYRPPRLRLSPYLLPGPPSDVVWCRIDDRANPCRSGSWMVATDQCSTSNSGHQDIRDFEKGHRNLRARGNRMSFHCHDLIRI